MKLSKTILLTILIAALLVSSAHSTEAELDTSSGQASVTEYQRIIAEYYQVSHNKVESIGRRAITIEETPVALFIAEAADVPVWAIIDLRSAGRSWIQISWHYGLSAEVYYIPFDRDPGPPYGQAWRRYNNEPRSKWKDIRLTDGEIINLVNLQFIADHYGYDRYEVIKLRSEGETFAAINSEVARRSSERRAKETQAKADRRDQDQRTGAKSKEPDKQ